MRVGVAYADAGQSVWLRIEVPEGATAGDAIACSGLLEKFPSIDLDAQKIGIFGKVVSADTPLNPGDRVEVYRAIVCDPTQVPRRDTDGTDDD